MPTDLTPHGAQPQRKEFRVTGRFVLFTLLTFFVVVASVNGIMMTLAIRSHPGVDAKNGYEVSQAYNREIAAAKVQAERGWKTDIMLTRASGAAKLAFTLKGSDGAPVTGLKVDARLLHLTDRKQDHELLLGEVSPGVYEARETGVPNGGWGITVVARSATGERLYESHSRALLQD